MAGSPAYVGTPRTAMAQISTANTLRDGTGTLGTVWTAGTSGSRIESIVIEATSTTTAGMVRLFLHDGTNARLWREINVDALIPSATVKAFTTTLDADSNPRLLCILPTGWSLRASTHNAETFNVIASGGDY